MSLKSNVHCLLPLCWTIIDFVSVKAKESWNEPTHDKTNKMACAPSEDSDQPGLCPGWSESSLSTWRKLGSLATHWAHSEDSDQTGMPRLICLRWAHMPLCWFCHEVAQITDCLELQTLKLLYVSCLTTSFCFVLKKKIVLENVNSHCF